MQDVYQKSIAQIFATIHDSVSKCSRRMEIEMKRHNYVTPTNYLELVAGYKKLTINLKLNTLSLIFFCSI